MTVGTWTCLIIHLCAGLHASRKKVLAVLYYTDIYKYMGKN